MNPGDIGKSTVIVEQLCNIEVRPINRNERSQGDELVRHYHYLRASFRHWGKHQYIAIHHGRWLALIGGLRLRSSARYMISGLDCLLFISTNACILLPTTAVS